MRSEGIETVTFHRGLQLGPPDGFDHDVHIDTAKGLVKQGLNTAKIDEIESPTGGGRNDDIDIARGASRIASHGPENPRVRDPPRL